MSYTGAAKIVAPDSYSVYSFEAWLQLPLYKHNGIIQGIGYKFQVPEVVILAQFNSIPINHISLNKTNLSRRDHHKCQYCGREICDTEATIDHVLPKSRDGRTCWTNCVLACGRCNILKDNMLPHEAGMSLRKKPVYPTWAMILNDNKSFPLSSWQKFLNNNS